MPTITEYSRVVEIMTRCGFVSLYPNSGAFGFPPESGAASVGWIGPDDPSIRPESRFLARRVAEPYESTLAMLCTQMWTEAIRTWAWVMPKSHWAYELTFGSPEWLPQLLRETGVSAEDLRDRHDGSAVSFNLDEAATFEPFLEGLLRGLFGSDFLVAWPASRIACTVHHHKQLWWTTTDPDLRRKLDLIVPPPGEGVR